VDLVKLPRKRWEIVYRDVDGRVLDRSQFWFRRNAVGTAEILNARAREVAGEIQKLVPDETLPPHLYTATVERLA